MNTTEYRTINGRNPGECTWCGGATGHPSKIWCNGVKCLKAFVLAERIVVVEVSPVKQRNRNKPERWHYRYDIHDAQAVEEMGGRPLSEVAQQLQRSETGLKVFCKSPKARARAKSYLQERRQNNGAR